MNISLIIVNYQQGEFLIPLLKYLWKSAKDWLQYQVEILVIDNLSPESEKIKKILSAEEQKINPNIKATYVFLDKNYGPSYSRNKGVEQANGEYIQFLDADDWIDPIKIITQYNFAIKNGYPSFVTSKWARVTWESTWDNRKDVSIHQPHFTNPIPISIIKSDGFIHLMSGLIKRESFLKAGGFREDMWLIEDVRLLIDLYQVEPSFAICPSDKPLFFYRVGYSQSLSSSRKLDFCNACYSNTVYVDDLMSFGELGESELQVLLEVYGQLARFFFEHDRAKFYEVLARIHKVDPKYIPSNPKSLRQFSKWLGYERAEAIALKYRQLKKILKSASMYKYTTNRAMFIQNKNLIYKLIDNRITRLFRPQLDRFLASTKLGCSLYNAIANYQSPIIRQILHSQSSRSIYDHTVIFGNSVFLLNFVNGKIFVPLRSSHSGFDWDTALSVLGHDIEVKEVYRIYLSIIKSPRFFDIGANFGTHTALFLANHGEVYSFEPLPQYKQYFLELCRINGWNYNNWHEIALSDTDGLVTLTYPKNQEWLATISNPKKSNEENTEYLQSKQVKITCFDNLKLDCKNALIKIDTEGHEVSVLNGSLQSNINESFGIVFESNESKDRDQIMTIANKLNFSIVELKQTELYLVDLDHFRTSKATNFFMGSHHSCKVLIDNWRL